VTDAKNRSGTDLEMRLKANVPRSRSEKTLKNTEQGVEDKLTIMTQMFWIAVSLLESDYEYEFLLATKLLDKVSILWQMTYHMVAFFEEVRACSFA
jgi:hypothetical protein